MITPYTTKTGLKIGAFYQPPCDIPQLDRDAARLQRALLGEPTPVDWDGIVIVIASCVLAIAVWMLA